MIKCRHNVRCPCSTWKCRTHKDQKGLPPFACMCSVHKVLYFHGKYTYTLWQYTDQAQSKQSGDGEVVAFVITQHAGPSEETETVEGVSGAGQATCHWEKEESGVCRSYSKCIYNICLFFVFFIKRKKRKGNQSYLPCFLPLTTGRISHSQSRQLGPQ